jgi:hypothetical protein
VWANHLAELCEMGEMAFPVKKRTAKLPLKLLNRARE